MQAVTSSDFTITSRGAPGEFVAVVECYTFCLSVPKIDILIKVQYHENVVFFRKGHYFNVVTLRENSRDPTPISEPGPW